MSDALRLGEKTRSMTVAVDPTERGDGFGFPLTRRGFVSGVAGATALGALGWPRMALASAPGEPRLVVVLLRGGMDGLTAVAPHGDPHYERARAGIAEPAPAEGDRRWLDPVFALHPNLAFMSELYARSELVVFHAISSPYRARSHFDGQNVLETGLGTPFASREGWLGRSLAALPVASALGRGAGLAISSTLPLVLRGPASVSTWSPSPLDPPSEALLARIERVYAPDAVLRDSLTRAIAAQRIARQVGEFEDRAPFVDAARAAGVFLREPLGPRVAVLDFDGWDTHAYQDLSFGALPRNLAALDRGLRSLARELGPLWRNTAVLVSTEFGRTVAMNGSHGTDHGTGGLAFLAGGAVQGGRVVVDWPGLAKREQYEGRDLRPTRDLRGVFKGVLHDHLQIAGRALEAEVFPESADAPRVEGLIRPS